MNEITLASSLVQLISTLIGNIFMNYGCLNVDGIHSNQEQHRHELVLKLHENNFTLIVSDNFGNFDEQCGFFMFGSNPKLIARLGNQTFDSIIRVLVVSNNCSRILAWLEENSTLQDMDILLAEVVTSPHTALTRIYRKSRHSLRMERLNIDLDAPFFVPVSRCDSKIRQILSLDQENQKKKNRLGTVELADGVETRVIREIAKKLNLVPDVVVPQDGKRWGTAYPNKTISGGILKSLYIKETDVGFCSLWIEHTKFPYIRMSGYWEILCLKFLIPKPKVVAAHWNNIFKPLPTNLWTLVLLTAIITSAVSSCLRFLHRLLFNMRPEREKFISEIVTIVGMLVLAKNPDTAHERPANRHLFLWWSIFAMIITSIYSSSLVSHLTYPQFEPMIDTAEQFVKAGLYWGTPYEPPVSHIFDIKNKWHQKFADRFQFEEQRTDRVRRIREGNYSVFVKCIGDVHFMEVQDVPIKILRELRTPKSCFNYFMLGLGYRKTLPYAHQANRIVRHLVESGITKYWLDRLFEKEYRSTTFAKVYEYKIPPENVKLQALSLLNLQGVFGLLSAGMGAACLVFACEILKRF